MDSLVPWSPCPYCSKEMNGATDPDGKAAPKPGDYTICLYCRGVCVFGADLKLRMPTFEELRQIDELPELRDTIRRYQLAAAVTMEGN